MGCPQKDRVRNVSKLMYRYSKRKFHDELLQKGKIRIGTLYDYRQQEARGIADPSEGRKSVQTIIDHLDASKANDQEAKVLKEFSVLDSSKRPKVKFVNCRFTREFTCPDCFVFCVSESFSVETMRQFEDADSCVNICNSDLFFKILTEELNKHIPVKFMGMHKVVYQERVENWNGTNWGRHPAVIKEPRFSQQFEIRALWSPKFSEGLTPIILCNSQLCQCCKMVDMSSMKG